MTSASPSLPGRLSGTSENVEVMPTVFIPHGGGPMPILGDKGHHQLVKFLRGFTDKHLSRYSHGIPKAILLISAHWEERQPTIQANPQPPLIYDYYGFPKQAYTLEYPAKGDPRLVERVAELLKLANIPCKQNIERGYDHGVFIPLKLMFPKAVIPVVQLSLLSSLSPVEHLRLGRALSPLRNEGVLIVGSGMSFHGDFFQPSSKTQSINFHTYLRHAVLETAQGKERTKLLIDWEAGPDARASHPREEHLLPLLTVIGAAENGKAEEVFYDEVMGIMVAAYLFH